MYIAAVGIDLGKTKSHLVALDDSHEEDETGNWL
jgi:hypothetical protein